MGGGVVGLKVDSPLERRAGLGGLAGLEPEQAKVVMGLGNIGRPADDFAIRGGGAVQLTLAGEEIGKRHAGVEVGGIEGKGVVQFPGGGGGVSGAREDEGEIVVGIGEIGIGEN